MNNRCSTGPTRSLPRTTFLVLLVTACSICFAASLDADEVVVEIVLGPETVAADRKTPPQPGQLNTPFGIAFDKNDDMYIVEFVGGRIHKYSPADKRLVHIAGKPKSPGYTDGPALGAQFQDMHNILIASNGDLLLSDHKNNAVRRYDRKNKTVSTFAGGHKAGFAGDGGLAAKAKFNMVMSVGRSWDNKLLLIADIKNYRIRAIDFETTIVSTVAGNGKRGVPKDGSPALRAPLKDPRACEMDAQGRLYIIERGGHSLRVVENGKVTTVAGTGKKGSQDGDARKASMNGPKHLTIDADGTVYIADDFNHAIRKYDPHAKTLTTILGRGDVKLNRPHGVTIHKGWLYVADSYNHRILRLKL